MRVTVTMGMIVLVVKERVAVIVVVHQLFRDVREHFT
jgi:hypothetical protein